MTIGSQSISVVVQGRVFHVPADKISDVYNLLTRLSSIAVQENNVNGVPIQYQGKSLIQE